MVCCQAIACVSLPTRLLPDFSFGSNVLVMRSREQTLFHFISYTATGCRSVLIEENIQRKKPLYLPRKIITFSGKSNLSEKTVDLK